MQEKTNPPVPGDMGGGKQGGQGDIGKKGGAPLETPNVKRRTDVPDKGGDVRTPQA